MTYNLSTFKIYLKIDRITVLYNKCSKVNIGIFSTSTTVSMNPEKPTITHPVRIKIKVSEVPQGQEFDFIEQQVALLAKQE